MTDVQKILKAVSSHTITVDTCDRLIRALDAIPEYQHSNFLLAFFHDEPEPDEQPEDYLAVKTFDSPTIGIGDEIIVCNGLRGVYIGTKYSGDVICGYWLITERGEICNYYDTCAWERTGRNFPAIPAILQELKKGVDKSAQEG